MFARLLLIHFFIRSFIHLFVSYNFVVSHLSTGISEATYIFIHNTSEVRQWVREEKRKKHHHVHTLVVQKMLENGRERGRKLALFGYFAIVGGFFTTHTHMPTTNTIIKVNNNKCKRTFDMIVQEMPLHLLIKLNWIEIVKILFEKKLRFWLDVCAKLVTQELHNFASFAGTSSSRHHWLFVVFLSSVCVYPCTCSMLASRLLYLHLVSSLIVPFDNCIYFFVSSLVCFNLNKNRLSYVSVFFLVQIFSSSLCYFPWIKLVICLD